LVGRPVGESVATRVGVPVGATVVALVGRLVGAMVGRFVGASVGISVEIFEGVAVATQSGNSHVVGLRTSVVPSGQFFRSGGQTPGKRLKVPSEGSLVNRGEGREVDALDERLEGLLLGERE